MLEVFPVPLANEGLAVFEILDGVGAAVKAVALAADPRVTLAQPDIVYDTSQEAAGAAETYGNLKTRLEQVARQAADFQALLARVKALRQQGASPEPSVVTVTAENSGSSIDRRASTIA